MIFKKRAKAASVDHMQVIDELAASGKPVFIDFWQTNCQSCRTMEGIVNELADEYRDSAHIVKVNVRAVPEAARRYRIQATPTFIVIGSRQKKQSKKSRNKGPGAPSERWRASGLVKKDQLQTALERNGAVRGQ